MQQKARRRYTVPNVYKAVTTTAQFVKAADSKPNANTKFKYDTDVVGSDFLPDLPTYQTIEQIYA